jgi:GNAT superfamily N-acetyltransferase
MRRHRGVVNMDAQVTTLARVRLAGPADEQQVIRLLLLSHAENGVQPADNAKVLWHIRRCLFAHLIPPEDTGPRGVFGVIGPVGALEAVIMIMIGVYWYTTEKHLEEFLIFVDPNFRNGNVRHGQLLIEWAKEQARKTKLKLFTGVLSNSRTEAKCRLYRRKLSKVGEYFMYNGTDEPDFNSDLLTGPPLPRPQLVRSSSAAVA